MHNVPWVFVDIETNGANGPRGRIIEIAAIKVIDGVIIDSFTSYVNPGSRLPIWITSLTGIVDNDLIQAPYFTDIAEQLHGFMHECLFIAHNVLFDYSFLKREFQNAGYAFSPRLFCTVKMSRSLFSEHQGHSLEKIIARHNIPVAARHRAYDDARAMYDFTMLAIKEKGIEAFEQNLRLQTKTKNLPPNVDEQVILDLPDSPGVYIFEDNDQQPLYVGKSINIRTRVRSHFANATSIAKEMKMALQSHNVTYIPTETEIEALLLESAKIKELQPIHNRRLRRKKTQAILVKDMTPDGYLTFTIKNEDLSTYTNLTDVYGVFQTPKQAKDTLEGIARTYQLCPKLLGLEQVTGACFRYQLGFCKGACIDLEPADSYNKRVEFALARTKIETWPFASKIAVAISTTRSLIIDQWIPQGIVDHENEDEIALIENSFDIDTYKILRSFLKQHKQSIRPYFDTSSFGI
jgi:DNA polymerase-3 subunit epsilon